MSEYRISPLTTTFGARVSGVDLRDPLDSGVADSLVRDLLEFRVLILDGQDLTHADHLRVSRIFGEPDHHVQDQFTVPGFPQIVMIGDIHRDGAPIGLYDGDNEQEWHTDLSFLPAMSAVSLLYSAVAPDEGGETRFADTTAAYDDLPGDVRARIDPLTAVHSMTHLVARQTADNPAKVLLTAAQRAQVPDVEHPLVRVHPVTGRRALLLGDMIIREVHGLGTEESEALLDQLHEHATDPKYVYTHRWQVGDLAIWDNRATMHTASPCDHTRHQRLLYRTTLM